MSGAAPIAYVKTNKQTNIVMQCKCSRAWTNTTDTTLTVLAAGALLSVFLHRNIANHRQKGDAELI